MTTEGRHKAGVSQHRRREPGCPFVHTRRTNTDQLDLSHHLSSQFDFGYRVIEICGRREGFEEFAPRRRQPALNALGIDRPTEITIKARDSLLGRGLAGLQGLVDSSLGAPRLSGRSTIATIVDLLCPDPPKRVPLVVSRTLLTPTCSSILNRMAQYSPVLDRTFSALADANRRQILDRIGEGQVSISELAEPLHMSLPGVLKHVRALEEAHLVVTAKRGRTRWCRLAERPLDAAAIWIEEHRTLWDRRLDRFERHLDDLEGTAR
jgi:DNA-binding transcriptional ArsR family regulator